MNYTLKVVSLFACDCLGQAFNEPLSDPTMRDHVVVCRLLLILQQMYKFNITYKNMSINMELRGKEEVKLLEQLGNGSVDVYTRAMSLRPELLDYIQPVHEIYKWRLGFLLRRPDFGIFRSFFREPFEMPVWYCIYLLTVTVIFLFYMLRVFEKRLVKQNYRDECSLSSEFVVAFSSVCQTSVPINPISNSRRTAYVTYFLFCYLMYTYYTSNLLYHLVNIGPNTMDIDGLTRSDYKCVILNTSSMRNIFQLKLGEEAERLKKVKFETIKYMNIDDALAAIKNDNTAVLSDYLSLYPKVKYSFEGVQFCQLVEVDIFSEMQKFIWISKHSRLRENMKIGILRTMEIGILGRLSRVREPSPPGCVSTGHVRAYVTHIMSPLAMLLSTSGVCVVLVMAERYYYFKHLPLPYIE